MVELFKNPEILDCSLCFERYNGMCPEHKLMTSFRDDPYLEECVNLLIKERVQEAEEKALASKKPWWRIV